MHTSGPWWIDDDGFVAAGSGETYVTVADPHCAEVGDIRGIDERKANARLISAAPAMLQALLDALPYVEDVLSDPAALACFKPGTVERHAKAIRAAISAATED